MIGLTVQLPVHEFAFKTFQVNVELPPEFIDIGSAVKSTVVLSVGTPFQVNETYVYVLGVTAVLVK